MLSVDPSKRPTSSDLIDDFKLLNRKLNPSYNQPDFEESKSMVVDMSHETSKIRDICK